MSCWTEDEGSRVIVSRRGSRGDEGLSVVVCAVEGSGVNAGGGCGSSSEGGCGGMVGRFLGGPGLGSR